MASGPEAMEPLPISPESAPLDDPAADHPTDRKFVWILAILLAILISLPTLAGIMNTPAGKTYLGVQYNFDDHMVYAAWMNQAAEGRFLFDNRFAVDTQPGLTFHLYFLVMGWLVKFIGLVPAITLARVGFSILAVWLLYRLVRRLEWSQNQTRMAMVFATVGAGVGFLVWHNFGRVLERPTPEVLNRFFAGRQPNDIWQPEAFFFSSALTNSLFAVSLCLILYLFDCFLEAQSNPRAVLPGAIAMGVLMNIHSYDVLIILFTMIGVLVMAWARDFVNRTWFVRCLLIGAGAILPALWFVYVLRTDPVFQSRAATPTFSPNFRTVIGGMLLMILLAFPALLHSRDKKKRPIFAGYLVAITLGFLFVMAKIQPDNGFWLTALQWTGLYAFFVFLMYSFASTNQARNLFVAWALAGLVAIYFPALFQRKLAMGLAIPWAVLAAGGLGYLVAEQPQKTKRLVAALAAVLLGASSVRWFAREFEYQRLNVTSTTLQPVFVSNDVIDIANELRRNGKRNVVVSMPGLAHPGRTEDGRQIPDSFLTPDLVDVAPYLSGLGLAYTYAGHWSETPDYGKRYQETIRFFTAEQTIEARREWLKKVGATHLVFPTPQSLPQNAPPSITGFIGTAVQLGSVTKEGNDFILVELNP